jgi:hypothetical protein
MNRSSLATAAIPSKIAIAPPNIISTAAKTVIPDVGPCQGRGSVASADLCCVA